MDDVQKTIFIRRIDDMIRTSEELINAVKERLGDDTSDEALALLEDVSDTLGDYNDKLTDTTDWKTKYEELDTSWRQKYRDRFMSGSSQEDEKEDEPEENPAPKTFADLFTTT